MKVLNIKIDDWTHKHLKTWATFNELTLGNAIKMLMQEKLQQTNALSENCELCRKYGHEPNEETAKVLRESRAGIGLSKPMSGEDYIKKLDKEFGK